MSSIHPFKDNDNTIDELSAPIFFREQTQHSPPHITPSFQLHSPSHIYDYKEQVPDSEPPKERSHTNTSTYPQSDQEGLWGFHASAQSPTLLSCNDLKQRTHNRKPMLHRIKKLQKDVKQLQQNSRGRIARAGVWRASASVYRTASEVKILRGLVKKLKRGVELTQELREREEKLRLQRMVFKRRG